MSFDRNLCKVLVADDSRLVTSSVTAILRQLDLSDIYYAYKPLRSSIFVSKCILIW